MAEDIKTALAVLEQSHFNNLMMRYSALCGPVAWRS